MGFFDAFRWPKYGDDRPEGPRGYDPTNLKVTDLRRGFVFEYDLKTWMVKEEYQYDWGDQHFTHEYKVDTGGEVRFLHVEDDDELHLTLSRKVPIRSLDEDIIEYTIEHQKPPKRLTYEGKKFFLNEESYGYLRDLNDVTDEWSELISWEYYDAEERHVITVEQWGERKFEAAYGEVVKPFQITNILPGEA